MPKTLSRYSCQTCSTVTSKWSGRCESCGSWNSLVESAVSVGATVVKSEPMSAIATKSFQRFSSQWPEFDQVVGGGIVPGSVLLLAGEPGIGKSTLILQLASHSGKSESILYVSGEESTTQIKLRAERLGLGNSNLEVLAHTDLEAITALAESGNYKLVVVDSIQTIYSQAIPAAAGQVSQVTLAAQRLHRAAKVGGAAVLMIGHITKDGSLAGPKTLEHLVDTVLYFEGERSSGLRMLRTIKNRFGSTHEVGIFEMSGEGLVPVTNPSAVLLGERHPGPGSVVVPVMEGSRPLLAEVQALVVTTQFGYAKRTAVGFDLNRLNLLIAVLQKRGGINLSNQDIYVNIASGLKVTEPAADLAIILSIASAYKNSQVANDLIAFGEVGLNGEIRPVQAVAKRISEASKLGFKQFVGPLAGHKERLTGVRTVTEALAVALKKS